MVLRKFLNNKIIKLDGNDFYGLKADYYNKEFKKSDNLLKRFTN